MGSAWFRGEGGGLHEFDLPLPPVYADQLRLGRLVPCPPPDLDGTRPAPMPVAATRPADTAPKSLWMEYAIARGMTRADANNTTKAELITMFGDGDGDGDGDGVGGEG